MKYFLMFILLTSIGLSEEAEEVKDPPKPTVEQLQAENKWLKAQLYQLQLEHNFTQQVCSIPEVMNAKIAVIQAAKEMEESKKVKKDETVNTK